MSQLEALSIDTQKDEIIARLILQKCTLYIGYTERWLADWLSDKELQHVIKYTVQSDREVFKDVFEELGEN